MIFDKRVLEIEQLEQALIYKVLGKEDQKQGQHVLCQRGDKFNLYYDLLAERTISVVAIGFKFSACYKIRAWFANRVDIRTCARKDRLLRVVYDLLMSASLSVLYWRQQDVSDGHENRYHEHDEYGVLGR